MSRPPWFKPAPKPANFDAMAAVWDEPMGFEAQVAIYRDQLHGADWLDGSDV